MDNDNEFNYSSDNNFKQVPVKNKNGFGKTVFVPLISGIVGAALVVGVCFGIPSVKERLLSLNSSTASENGSSNSSTSANSEYNATLMDIAEYSETSVAVAESVLPSVVGITVEYNVSSFGQSGIATATGSGVIISEDGYIITNNHVINAESSSIYYQVTEATSIKVHLYGDSDDVQYEAEVVGSDSTSDLAVLKIEPDQELTAIKIGDSDNLRVGEFVMAVGNPLGLDSSVTCGVISALNREVTDSDGNTYLTIQTDAAINSGNSGGALVNSKGELIGINSLKLSNSSSSETTIEGIGFAIPVNSSMDIIDQLIEYGTVRRPYIGISGSSLTEALSERYNYPVGVYVESVEEGGPAEEAGLEVGDVITEVDGQAVESVEEINTIKNTYSIGDTISLTVYRNNDYITVDVTLGETPEETEEETPTLENQSDLYNYYFNY